MRRTDIEAELDRINTHRDTLTTAQMLIYLRALVDVAESRVLSSVNDRNTRSEMYREAVDAINNRRGIRPETTGGVPGARRRFPN